MRFKVKSNSSAKHLDMVNSITWTLNNEVFSISDDKTLYKWDLNSPNPQKLLELD